MAKALNAVVEGLAPSHASALDTAKKITDGTLLPQDLFGEKIDFLQPLLVRLCSQPDQEDIMGSAKIRLEALTAIANQGLSVNGVPGTTTPLHMACASRSIDLTSALLTFGGNPRAKDEEGKIPAQKIPEDAPERADLVRMLRAAELRMTAMQAIEGMDPQGDLRVGAGDVLVARAFRGAVKKMGL